MPHGHSFVVSGASWISAPTCPEKKGAVRQEPIFNLVEVQRPVFKCRKDYAIDNQFKLDGIRLAFVENDRGTNDRRLQLFLFPKPHAGSFYPQRGMFRSADSRAQDLRPQLSAGRPIDHVGKAKRPSGGPGLLPLHLAHAASGSMRLPCSCPPPRLGSTLFDPKGVNAYPRTPAPGCNGRFFDPVKRSGFQFGGAFGYRKDTHDFP